jgi:plastocyanin
VRRLAGLGLAGVAALALLGVTAAGARAPASTSTASRHTKSARVTVNDFYFGPDEVTIEKGGTVKWVWSSTNTYPHDVHLKRGPKGLKERGTYSTETTAVTDAEFKKAFETAGTYHFICTIHPTQMHITVVVRK